MNQSNEKVEEIVSHCRTSQLLMKDDDYDDDEANKFGGENAAAFGGGLFGDIFYKDDEEEIIEKGPDTSDDLLNDLLHEIGQDFGGLGRLLPH